MAAVTHSPRASAPTYRWRRAAAIAAFTCLAAALLGAAAHFWTPGPAFVLGISAFAPYLLLGAPPALLLLLALRRWPGAVAAALLCVVWVVTQAPLFVAADPPADARTVVTMTANLRFGEASPASVVAAVRRHGVQVLMLEE